MHPLVEKFFERPSSHKIGFWLISLLLPIVIFWLYIFKDKLHQLDKLNQEYDQLTSQINHERRLAKNLDRVKEAVKELDIKLQMALKELPDSREISELLSSISNLARNAGLEVALFKPNPENLRDFYAEVPVSISVAGTYHQVATFFDEVAQLDRIVNINQIAMQSPHVGQDKVVIKTDCTATTFRYLEESERKQVEAQNKQRQRRRR